MHLEIFILALPAVLGAQLAFIVLSFKRSGAIFLKPISISAIATLVVIGVVVGLTEWKGIPFEDSIAFRDYPYHWLILLGIISFSLLLLSACRNKLLIKNRSGYAVLEPLKERLA